MSFESMRNVQVIEYDNKSGYALGVPIAAQTDAPFNGHLDPDQNSMFTSANATGLYNALREAAIPIFGDLGIENFTLDEIMVNSGKSSGNGIEYTNNFNMYLVDGGKKAVRVEKDDRTAVYLPRGMTALVYGEPCNQNPSPNTFPIVKEAKAGKSRRTIKTYNLCEDNPSIVIGAYRAAIDHLKESDVQEVDLKLKVSHKEGPRVTPKEIYLTADFNKGQYSLIN